MGTVIKYLDLSLDDIRDENDQIGSRDIGLSVARSLDK